HDVGLFADGGEPFPGGPAVRPTDEVEDFLGTSGVLICHHSGGWDRGPELVRRLRCRRVVRYHNVTPPEFFQGVSATYRGACGDGKTNVLAVGRVAPNKGHAELIDAFAVYHHEYCRDSRLLVAGKEDPRLGAYTVRLHARVLEQGLGDAVVFLGETSAAELKA